MAEAPSTRRLAGVALAAALICGLTPADAAPRHRPRQASGGSETISVFAGPCRDGSCAVYRFAVSADGTMSYTGMAHTSVLGSRQSVVGREAYAELASTLSPFRPRTTNEGCALRDGGPTYRITWSGAGGSRTLYHAIGCSTARDNVLDAILINAPSRLGIGEWSAAQQSPTSVFKPHIFYF